MQRASISLRSHHSWSPRKKKGIKNPHLIYSLGLVLRKSLCKLLLLSWICFLVVPFVHDSVRGLAALCGQVSQKLGKQGPHPWALPWRPQTQGEKFGKAVLWQPQGGDKQGVCASQGSPALGMVPEKGQETRADHSTRERGFSMRPFTWGVRPRPIQEAGPEAGLETWQLSAGLKYWNLLMSLSHQQGHKLKTLVGVCSPRDTLSNQPSAGFVLLITTLETS